MIDLSGFLGCFRVFPRTFRSFEQAVTSEPVSAYIEILATIPIFGKIFFPSVKVTDGGTNLL